VHSPDSLIEQPSNVRQWATEVLGMNFKNSTLSSNAKVGFVMAQGRLSFEESLEQVKKDLPEQMRLFMTNNGLEPSAYDMPSFSEDLRNDLKILCMAAIRSKKKWWEFWK